MILAAALASATVLIAAGLAWIARLVHIGNLDAHDLAAKVSVPSPVSALDWPELHLNAVVAQPDEQPVVLLHVGWPAHPQRAATLLLALDRDDRHALPLLSQWCADQASVSPARQDGAELILRRRQSLERVHAVLVAEDSAPSGLGRTGATCSGRPARPLAARAAASGLLPAARGRSLPRGESSA